MKQSTLTALPTVADIIKIINSLSRATTQLRMSVSRSSVSSTSVDDDIAIKESDLRFIADDLERIQASCSSLTQSLPPNLEAKDQQPTEISTDMLLAIEQKIPQMYASSKKIFDNLPMYFTGPVEGRKEVYKIYANSISTINQEMLNLKQATLALLKQLNFAGKSELPQLLYRQIENISYYHDEIFQLLPSKISGNLNNSHTSLDPGPGDKVVLRLSHIKQVTFGISLLTLLAQNITPAFWILNIIVEYSSDEKKSSRTNLENRDLVSEKIPLLSDKLYFFTSRLARFKPGPQSTMKDPTSVGESEKTQNAIRKLQDELQDRESCIIQQQSKIATLTSRLSELELLLADRTDHSQAEETPTKNISAQATGAAPVTQTVKRESKEREKRPRITDPSILSGMRQPNFSLQKESDGDEESDDSVEDTKAIFSIAEKTKSYTPDLVPLQIELPLPYDFSKEDNDSLKDSLLQLYTIVPSDSLFEESIPGKSATSSIYAMSPELWPILPPGYRWFSEEKIKIPVVQKYNDKFAQTDINIVVYGPNSSGQVNYLTVFDKTTVQSFTNTRSPTYQGKRTQKISYDRYLQAGHCIDHRDTLEPGGLSTIDPRNFIPEHTIWNTVIRNNYVRHIIRNNKGAYLQNVYYHDYNPLIFRPDKTVIDKISKTVIALPKGVYFSEVNTNQQFIKTLDVNWKSRLFGLIKKAQTQYLKGIEIFALPEFGTGPNAIYYNSRWSCSHLDHKLNFHSQNILTIQNDMKKNLQTENAFRREYVDKRNQRARFNHLHQAATLEYLSPYYKFCLAIKCAETGDLPNAHLFLKWAGEHLSLLKSHDLGESKPVLRLSEFTTFKQLKNQQPHLDTHNQHEDTWAKLIKR